MRFYLGVHRAAWPHTLGVPTFVSRRVLAQTKNLKPASAPWALDSGGFTELSLHGEWRTTPREYIADIRRFAEQMGPPDFVAQQDWMVEPQMLARTGLTVKEHQVRTINNYVELMSIGVQAHLLPTLQGWTLDDYLAHESMWADAGIDLSEEPLVGVGSVCRRQATAEIGTIMQSFSHLNLHGFGVKLKGLALYGHLLTSADSMAWSYNGRRNPPCPHAPGRKNCANCPEHALAWRQRVVS